MMSWADLAKLSAERPPTFSMDIDKSRRYGTVNRAAVGHPTVFDCLYPKQQLGDSDSD